MDEKYAETLLMKVQTYEDQREGSVEKGERSKEKGERMSSLRKGCEQSLRKGCEQSRRKGCEQRKDFK